MDRKTAYCYLNCGTTNGNPIGIEKINISISFYDPVKLYDRYGNDVRNIIGAYFDECHACKLWMAPSCHFRSLNFGVIFIYMSLSSPIPYCCLNCAGTQNCCGVCGECPTYCERCKDVNTESCQDWAFFKDGVFYKDAIYFSSYSLSVNIKNIDTGPEGKYIEMIGLSYAYSSLGNLDSNDKKNKRSGHVSSQLDYGFEWSKGITEYDGYNIITKGKGCSECDAEDCPPCPEGGKQFGSTTTDTWALSDPVKTSECSSFYHGCSTPHNCLPGCYYEDDCTGTARATATARVTFLNEVKLYNSSGEIVNSNIINANYDECNALRKWFAPACHFFYPAS